MVLGGLSSPFAQMTEGVGGVLAGFCLAMWLLAQKNGGLITSKAGKVIFIFVMSIVFGLLTFFFLPNNPVKSRLSHEEKIFIIERVRGNQTGVENKKWKWYQFKEVMLDIKPWLICCIVISTNVPNGAVSSFSSLIIEG